MKYFIFLLGVCCLLATATGQDYTPEYIRTYTKQKQAVDFLTKVRIFDFKGMEPITIKRAKPYQDSLQRWVIFFREGGEVNWQMTPGPGWQGEAEIAQQRFIIRAYHPDSCYIYAPADTFCMFSMDDSLCLYKQYRILVGEKPIQQYATLMTLYPMKPDYWEYRLNEAPMKLVNWHAGILASLWAMIRAH